MPAERAGYTVTMFVVDLSPSMGNVRTVELPDIDENGDHKTREMTNLEWAMQFVLIKIQEMIFNGRKTDKCGVILFGTADTRNIVNDENPDGYENVVEYIPIGQPNSGTLAKLQALQPSTVIGDPIDAIIVGVETQDRYLGNKKTWTRKMYLITDADNPIELDEWKTTVNKMNAVDLIFTIIGIDFDDPEFGYKQERKPHIKRENESFFSEFVSECKTGMIGTAAYALQECVRPEIKQTKSALIGSVLRIGDFEGRGERREEAMEVIIKTSKCTAIARPVSLKKFVRRTSGKKRSDTEGDDDPADDDDDDLKDIYVELRSHTDYLLQKEVTVNADGSQTHVDEESINNEESQNTVATSGKVEKESLIRGFKYGSTHVLCPDAQFPKLNTRKGISINGFFPHENLRRDFAMSEVQYVWADPSSGAAQIAFSSIIQAMMQSDVIAVARWVSRDDADPKMGVLIPRMMENADCFLWLQMPFADDIRKYNFGSLEHLTSKKGDPITVHSYLPTKEQIAAMDEFIESMDLMEVGDRDEEGRRLPWFDPRYSYNPAIHRIKQAAFHAAIVQDLRTNPVLSPHVEITKYLNPPKRVIKRAKDPMDSCKRAFKIKEVPKRVAARKRQEDHRRVENDEDEELLLDIVSRRPGSVLRGTWSQHVDDNKLESGIVFSAKQKGKNRNIGDDASETEDDANIDMIGTSSLPSADSGIIGWDPGRIIGRAHPLEDFKKNIARGDIVTKAVDDLAYIIKDIVMKPFASRRQDEILECMRVLRGTCMNEDEIDAWNAFLKELKKSCLSKKGINNLDFWNAVKTIGRELSLISSEEVAELGGVSNVTDHEAASFVAS